jgi:hypothetical protein
MRRSIIGLLCIALVTACPRPSTNEPIRGDDAGASKPTPVPAPVSAAPSIAPSDDVTSGEDAFCTGDADCSWDEPCMAKRCLGKPKTPFVGCDKSAPPPGTCTCIDHRCTLRRKTPLPPTPGCKVDADCTVVASLGVCKPGPRTSNRIEEEGTMCRCDAGACALEVVDAVPCKTSADCSWLEDPRRPAPASKVPRAFPPVKPCKDGEWDSVCAPSGHCRIVAWKC